MPDDLSALYDRDHFAWTQTQAEALRSRGAGGNVIDWERVAEEIEDMGRSDLRAVESLVIRIVQHLHYLRATRAQTPVRHWRAEIGSWRDQIRRRLTASLRKRLEEDWDALLEQGAREAARWAEVDQPFFDEIDMQRHWTLAQVLGEDDDPLA
jgi:hypothetical protein